MISVSIIISYHTIQHTSKTLCARQTNNKRQIGIVQPGSLVFGHYFVIHTQTVRKHSLFIYFFTVCYVQYTVAVCTLQTIMWTLFVWLKIRIFYCSMNAISSPPKRTYPFYSLWYGFTLIFTSVWATNTTISLLIHT